MALSTEEIAQASELLTTHERRLKIRDKQIARYGDADAPPEMLMEAEDLRKKIVALKAVLEPELPPEITGLIKRRAEDDYFIFQQTLGAKQDVAVLREDVAAIKTAQSLATTWRMQTDDWKARIEAQIRGSEAKRASGAIYYRIGLSIAIALALLALARAWGLL